MSADQGGMLTRKQAALDIFLLILLIPASAVAAAVIASWMSPRSPSLAILVIAQALLSLAGLHALLAWRNESWSDIGLQRLGREDFLRAALVLLTGFAAGAVLGGLVYSISPGTLEGHVAGLEFIARAFKDIPFAGAAALLFLVGFYEEVAARGLLLTRSRLLLGGFWAPVLFSAGLFGLGHLYQGAYGVVQTAVLGVVLAAFTLRWNTLWPAIIAHAAINTLSLVQFSGIHLPQ